MGNRAIIATSSYADKIEKLRRSSYNNSTAFKIIDSQVFETYCRWSKRDETGIVLVVINEYDEPISSLRGNVYFNSMEHTFNNPSFAGHTNEFVHYPVLDMTFAATSPQYFNAGLLSVLRYYMYVLHRHAINSISGQVVKGSSLYYSLHKMGYIFKEIDVTRPELEKSSKPSNKWMLSNLSVDKIDLAIGILKAKYFESIDQIPLIIN